MPKVNVYLPDELAADVQRFGVQLSLVCQRALREEVLRMATMNSVGQEQIALAVDRLRLSAHIEGETNWSLGRRAGRRWALEAAKRSELDALDRAEPVGGPVALERTSRCLQIANEIDYQDDLAWPTLPWNANPLPKRNWLGGFVDGALEVWERLRELV